MRVSPRSPRRQRKALYTEHTARRRRRMAVPLSRDLKKRFGRRAIPVRKGDTVRVLSGSFVGREERVAHVNRRNYSVTLDNVTLKTAEEKLKALPLRTSHLVLTRLNLSDPWRRRSLRAREEDVSAEERGEEAPTEAAIPSPADAAPSEPARPEPPTSAPDEPEAAAVAEAPDEVTETKPARRRKTKAAEKEAP